MFGNSPDVPHTDDLPRLLDTHCVKTLEPRLSVPTVSHRYPQEISENVLAVGGWRRKFFLGIDAESGSKDDGISQ